MTQKMTANIVGSSFYPNAANIIARLRPGAKLVLEREPKNPYDKNAIAVYFRFSGMDTKLGHLSRGLAELLAPKIDAGVEVRCTKAPIVGGVIYLEWDKAEDEPVIEETPDTYLQRFKGLIV
jgi:hypothetical protein